MKIHRGDRPYKSMECGKHFSVHSHLAVHEKLQAAEKHLVCEACGQKFQLLTEWKAHQKSHVTLGSLQAGHSWFRSEEKRAAGRTIKLEMSYENGGKSSGNENDSFARVTDSVVECSSTAQTAHMCNMCGKTFQARRRLVEHERIHTGEKPFSCSECGRRFSSRSQLTRHLRSHTEEKPYICTVCGMSVTHWSDMTVHQRMHVGETLHTASEGYLKEIKKERFIKTESPKEDPLRETLEEWIWHEQNATGATVPERNEAVERTFSCKLCDACGKRNLNYSYMMHGSTLAITAQEKDLGVIVDTMKPSAQCAAAAKKPNRMLGINRKGNGKPKMKML